MRHTLIDLMASLLVFLVGTAAAVILSGWSIGRTAQATVRAQRKDSTSHFKQPRTRQENNHG